MRKTVGILASLALLLLACASGPSLGAGCANRATLSFKRIDSGSYPAALFTIANKSAKRIEIPIDGQDIPQVHGAYSQLQMRKGERWEWYAPVLEHYFAPVSWLVLAKGGAATIRVDVGGPVIDRVSADSKFRVEIKDESDCLYTSDEFSIGVPSS